MLNFFLILGLENYFDADFGWFDANGEFQYWTDDEILAKANIPGLEKMNPFADAAQKEKEEEKKKEDDMKEKLADLESDERLAQEIKRARETYRTTVKHRRELKYTAYYAKGKESQWVACLGCRIILNKNQFREIGCPNCPELIPAPGPDSRYGANKEDAELEWRVNRYTTNMFSGYKTKIKEPSWVTRAAVIDEMYVIGCYAQVGTHYKFSI